MKHATLDFLTGTDCVVIGSAGLRLSEYNDIDVAVCAEDLPTGKLPGEIRRTDLRTYFSVFPLGNNVLIKLPKTDVIVYEKRESLEIVKRAMCDIKNVPKYILKD